MTPSSLSNALMSAIITVIVLRPAVSATWVGEARLAMSLYAQTAALMLENAFSLVAVIATNLLTVLIAHSSAAQEIAPTVVSATRTAIVNATSVFTERTAPRHIARGTAAALTEDACLPLVSASVPAISPVRIARTALSGSKESIVTSQRAPMSALDTGSA